MCHRQPVTVQHSTPWCKAPNLRNPPSPGSALVLCCFGGFRGEETRENTATRCKRLQRVSTTPTCVAPASPITPPHSAPFYSQGHPQRSFGRPVASASGRLHDQWHIPETQPSGGRLRLATEGGHSLRVALNSSSCSIAAPPRITDGQPAAKASTTHWQHQPRSSSARSRRRHWQLCPGLSHPFVLLGGYGHWADHSRFSSRFRLLVCRMYTTCRQQVRSGV